MNSEIVVDKGGAGNLSVAAFYGGILPPMGQRALAVFENGLKSAPTHAYYQDNDALIEAAETYSGLGKNVYHGCATFKDGSARTQANVVAVKSLWADFDVGPGKPYASAKQAAADIVRFAIMVGLPKPHLVRSGGGIHAYFAFTKPITDDQWLKLAELFAACMDHAKVYHDSSRTKDSASILRIPGTQNYKTNPPKPVILLQLGEEMAAAEIYKRLKAYADTNGVLVMGKARRVPRVMDQGNADLIGIKSYPPAYGEKAAKNCPVLGEVAETGGDVGYEIWWRSMGVAKHLQDADATAAHWTRNRAQTGHAQTDWQKAMDGWSVGPTTCAEFAKHSTKCKTCPHGGVAA